jgi:hypothetical protein
MPMATHSPSGCTSTQLPQTAPRLAGLIEGVFGPAASAEGTQGNPTLEPDLIEETQDRMMLVRAGPDSEFHAVT